MRIQAMLAIALIPALAGALGDDAATTRSLSAKDGRGGFVWSNASLERAETRRIERVKNEIAAVTKRLREQEPSARDSRQYAIDFYSTQKTLARYRKSPFWREEWDAEVGKFDPPSRAGVKEYIDYLAEVAGREGTRGGNRA